MGLCKPIIALFVLLRKVGECLPEEVGLEHGCKGGVILKELRIWLDWGE